MQGGSSHAGKQPASTSSPIIDAMRKLDSVSGTSGQPSLVRQLYALALLNREDAMRRLHNTGVAPDVALAQRPPSLLALAREPDDMAPTFRPVPAIPASPPRTAVGARRARPQPSRPFGTVSANAGSGGDATVAIRAARERSGPFGTGYGVPGRHERPVSHDSMYHSGLGPTSYASASSLYGYGERPRYGERPMPTRPATGGAAALPLRAADLEGTYPVREGRLRPLEPPGMALIRQSQAAEGAPLPVPRTVRALFEGPWLRPATLTEPGGRARGFVASSTGGSMPSSQGGLTKQSMMNQHATGGAQAGVLRHVRSGAAMEGEDGEHFDPFAAAEEDLRRSAEKRVHDEQVRWVPQSGSGSGLRLGLGSRVQGQGYGQHQGLVRVKVRVKVRIRAAERLVYDDQVNTSRAPTGLSDLSTDLSDLSSK